MKGGGFQFLARLHTLRMKSWRCRLHSTLYHPPTNMASQEMRFSLNERTPGAIKSQGGVSGQAVNVEDSASVQSILDTIHNTKAENHSGTTDWYVPMHLFRLHSPLDTLMEAHKMHGKPKFLCLWISGLARPI